MTGFRPFFNRATGEWIEFTAVTEDSDGQLVRFSWRSVPGGMITEHIHPRQEERFIITSGQARFTLDGEELVAGAGDTVVVPAGVRHSEGTPGPPRSRQWWSCGQRCGAKSSMRPSRAWPLTAGPRPGGRRVTRMCAAWGHRTSVTVGTIFDKTRTPLTVWFTACWSFATAKDGISALSLQRSLEIGSYQTAWAARLRPGRVLSELGKVRRVGTGCGCTSRSCMQGPRFLIAGGTQVTLRSLSEPGEFARIAAPVIEKALRRPGETTVPAAAWVLLSRSPARPATIRDAGPHAQVSPASPPSRRRSPSACCSPRTRSRHQPRPPRRRPAGPPASPSRPAHR